MTFKTSDFYQIQLRKTLQLQLQRGAVSVFSCAEILSGQKTAQHVSFFLDTQYIVTNK